MKFFRAAPLGKPLGFPYELRRAAAAANTPLATAAAVVAPSRHKALRYGSIPAPGGGAVRTALWSAQILILGIL